MQPGDEVAVKIGRGGVQRGTVVAVLPDGRFRWKNRCNYLRTSKPSDLTTGPEREAELDPYVAAWIAEEENDDE